MQVSASRASLDAGVVDVEAALGFQGAESFGTGIIVSSSGEVITNNHVINGATTVRAVVVSTGVTYTATVVGTDPSHDIAVLQLQRANGLTTVQLGNSDSVKVGAAITTVGNAGGRGGQPTITTGRVTALGRTVSATDESGGSSETLHGLIEVNAALQPGDSGGPLVDSHGAVVGIDSIGTQSARSAAARRGYAIPINTAIAVDRAIDAGQRSGAITLGRPAFLGILTASTGNAAVVVEQVLPRTAAATIGLRAGDRLVAVAGTTVHTVADLTAILHGLQAGRTVSITWITANGTTRHASAVLGSGPAN